MLSDGSPTTSQRFPGAFKDGLRELGWVEGQNFVLDIRFAEFNVERMAGAYRDLVRARADVLVASVNSSVIAAKRATSTLPIVMVRGVDPVGAGLVRSLARPGGNVTGLSSDVAPETTGKSLALLTAAVPRLQRVAVLWNPRFPGELQPYWKAVEDASRTLRLDVQRFEAQAPEDLDRIFAAITEAQAKGLLLFGPSAAMFGRLRERTVFLAAQHRLPTIYPTRPFVEAGGLMSYGPDPQWFWRKTAVYIDKLLKGAKPGDLPVEQPTKLELVVNLKTAKALGLTIPPSLLQRADQVIDP